MILGVFLQVGSAPQVARILQVCKSLKKVVHLMINFMINIYLFQSIIDKTSCFPVSYSLKMDNEKQECIYYRVHPDPETCSFSVCSMLKQNQRALFGTLVSRYSCRIKRADLS